MANSLETTFRPLVVFPILASRFDDQPDTMARTTTTTGTIHPAVCLRPLAKRGDWPFLGDGMADQDKTPSLLRLRAWMEDL
jgi:hypothetical protein